MKIRFISSLAAITALSSFTFQGAHAQSTFSLLGPAYGGVSSWGAGINDAGQVVGDSRDGNGGSTAVIWPGNGGVVTFNELGGYTGYGHATGINNSGQVVGLSGNPERATLWQQWTVSSSGPAVGLVTPSGAYSEAYGINNAGQVVGTATSTTTGNFHAALWTSGGLTDLGTLGGSFSTAYGINNVGQVVGYSADASSAYLRPALWSSGAVTDLGTLGGNGGVAKAINDEGHVVGSASTTAGFGHAALWANGGVTDLGTLGGTYSEADAINNGGHIVGWAGSSLGERAFIETEDSGVMIDLNTFLDANSKSSGWVLRDATGINNHDQVTGDAYNTLTGQERAYVLSVDLTALVPEPETYALMLAGLGVLGWTAKRRRHAN